MDEARKEQLCEVELMEAAFGSNFNLVDAVNLQFRITVEVERVSVVVTISLSTAPLRCVVDGALPNAALCELNAQLSSLQQQQPQTGSMDVVQHVTEFLQDWVSHTHASTTSTSTPHAHTPTHIARFLVFFHHIKSTTKRKLIIEHAIDLRLGGCSKPGFPGIVVVEGEPENVLEYVRRIQRLRWQQMVVRGEEVEALEMEGGAERGAGEGGEAGAGAGGEGGAQRWREGRAEREGAGAGGDPDSSTSILDQRRKMPLGFWELGEGGGGGGSGGGSGGGVGGGGGGSSMSQLASLCRQWHLTDLFMTAMKKYSSGGAEDQG